MRAPIAWLLSGWIAVSGAAISVLEAEAGEQNVSVTLAPVRYAFVKGDEEKFQSMHWMKAGYAGGIEDFASHFSFDNGVTLASHGHALIDDNDLASSLELTKEDLGFLHVDFEEFRRYYDGTGGVYYPFPTLSTSNTDKDLKLDIGKLELETGLTLEGWPELTFLYEREYKDGAKSRLTWVDTTEAIPTSTLRKIAPSWSDVDEIVDVVALEAAHELAGTKLTAEQRWEFVRSEILREERALDSTGTASAAKIRRQDMAPESTLMTTLVGTERSFMEGRAVTASAYRFAHMDNREFETIIETNASGVPTNFSNPEQKRDARSDVDYDVHTWTGSFSINPLRALTFTTKFKAEVIKQEGTSNYPADSSPNSSGGSTPNGVIDLNELGLTKNRANRWGESIGLQYSGLPYTAVYTDLELEQARVLLREDQTDLISPGTYTSGFFRETVTDVRRGAWTLGTRVAPWRVLDVTSHVRHRRNNNDYDDQRESTPASTTARSAFVEEQNVKTNEFALRTTLKPCRWFRSSFRYQLLDQDYISATEASALVTTDLTSHVYTYNVVVQPRSDVLVMASFSKQTLATETPARFGGSLVNTPTSHGDVNTWLLSADYTGLKSLTLTWAMQYSRTKNFNDWTTNGLPLGADFRYADLTLGATWTLDDTTSVSGEYDFSRYQTSSLADTGSYRANILWLRGTRKF